jgi:hypothetical protein
VHRRSGEETLDGSLLLHLHQLGFFLSRRDIRTLTKEGYFVMARTRRSHFRRRDHRRLLSNRWNERRDLNSKHLELIHADSRRTKRRIKHLWRTK